MQPHAFLSTEVPRRVPTIFLDVDTIPHWFGLVWSAASLFAGFQVIYCGRESGREREREREYFSTVCVTVFE